MKSYLSIGLNQIASSQDWRRATSLDVARFDGILANRNGGSSICGDRGNIDFYVDFSSAIQASNFIHPETYRISGRYRADAVPT